MIIDGHKVTYLPTGQISVTTDGVETVTDHDAALRYLHGICRERVVYELNRKFNQIFPKS